MFPFHTACVRFYYLADEYKKDLQDNKMILAKGLKKRRKKKKCAASIAHRKQFDMWARMTSSRSPVLFCVSECYKSDWAVHHSPWSCVTVSYTASRSTLMWACTLNLSTPPFFSVSTSGREKTWEKDFHCVLCHRHSFVCLFFLNNPQLLISPLSLWKDAEL